MQLEVDIERWPYRKPFRISRGVLDSSDVVVATLRAGEHAGRGECAPIDRFDGTPEEIREYLQGFADRLERGITREELTQLMPPSAARLALDAALWDLEAKRSGRSVWELASISPPQRLLVDLTLGIGTPEEMAADAADAASRGFQLVKCKLGAEGVEERLRAIREAAPSVRLIVDANEAWSLPALESYLPLLQETGVELIEQPLPSGHDQALLHFNSPIPLCADESCCTADDFEYLQGRYAYVCIKLEKTGGLTAALQAARKATDMGFEIMVGCNGGTSLNMSHGYVLGALASDYRDLDSPELIAEDREHGMVYRNGYLECFEPELWG